MITTKSIFKTFRINEENYVHALKDINLTIKDGEYIIITGRSGSGKTTLFNILSGLDIPSSGIVKLDSKDIFKLSENERTLLRRKEIGFIFQSYNLIPVLTAKENIELPQIENDEQYVNDLLKVMNIYDRRNHLPSELSGGQQQRVSICRALVNKPKIVFSDEPTGNLDSQTETEVINLLKSLVDKYNTTIVLITHNMELTKIADRVITLNDGEIVHEQKNI